MPDFQDEANQLKSKLGDMVNATPLVAAGNAIASVGNKTQQIYNNYLPMLQHYISRLSAARQWFSAQLPSLPAPPQDIELPPMKGKRANPNK